MAAVLLLVAAFGLIVPNGIFLYWLMFEAHSFRDILGNRLALGFIIDAMMATIILAVYFARRPIGPVRWGTFVLLSLIGGLGFSLPFYWWLNTRSSERLEHR